MSYSSLVYSTETGVTCPECEKSIDQCSCNHSRNPEDESKTVRVSSTNTRGYKVNGTLRDVNAPDKATFLNALPNADRNLRLFESEMADEESFIEAFSNVDCVFIACLIPVYKGHKENSLERWRMSKDMQKSSCLQSMVV